jgi:hypothetical protein
MNNRDKIKLQEIAIKYHRTALGVHKYVELVFWLSYAKPGQDLPRDFKKIFLKKNMKKRYYLL